LDLGAPNHRTPRVSPVCSCLAFCACNWTLTHHPHCSWVPRTSWITWRLQEFSRSCLSLSSHYWHVLLVSNFVFLLLVAAFNWIQRCHANLYVNLFASLWSSFNSLVVDSYVHIWGKPMVGRGWTSVSLCSSIIGETLECCSFSKQLPLCRRHVLDKTVLGQK
jgi:hypothetical protein